MTIWYDQPSYSEPVNAMFLLDHGFQYVHYERIAHIIDNLSYIPRSRKALENAHIYLDDKFVYKIFSNKIAGKKILAGIYKGFYDLTLVPALIGIVFQNNLPMGYIMHRCDTIERSFEPFIEILMERTKKTNLFFPDVVCGHFRSFCERVTLIDLEGIYHVVEKAPNFNFGPYGIRLPKNKMYENLVLELRREYVSKN